MSQQAAQIQAVQPTQPTLFNLPPHPQSTPDTPSEVPGTPTSTTTSLSAVSTTAMKDGQRGGHIPPLVLDGSGSGGMRGTGVVVSGSSGSNGIYRFGHQHSPSTNSLEAERADRISRLAGLSGVSTLRPVYAPNRGSGASVTSGGGGSNRFSGSGVFATTPTSTSGGGGSGGGGLGLLSNNMAVPGPLTPAFFDAQGQPVAITKMSTVGTASATDSVSGRTFDGNSTADGDTMTEDDDTDGDGSAAADDDIKSLGTNYRYSNARRDGSDAMMMDDDNTSRSIGGYEDRMSDDDGAASLVGFGEGAGSTVSGPIYHRRPLPLPAGSSDGAMMMAAYHVHNHSSGGGGSGSSAGNIAWGALERTNSGLSDVAIAGGSASGGPRSRGDHYYMRSALDNDDALLDSPTNSGTAAGTRNTEAAPAWPVIQAHPSALRETQRPRSHQQQQQTQYHHHQYQHHHHNHHNHSHSRQHSRVSREREAAEQLLQGVARYDGQVAPGTNSSDKLSKGDRRA